MFIEVVLAALCLIGGYQIGYTNFQEKWQLYKRIESLEDRIYEFEILREENAEPVQDSPGTPTATA